MQRWEDLWKHKLIKALCGEEARAWRWQGRIFLMVSKQKERQQQQRILKRWEKSWIWLDGYDQDQNELRLFTTKKCVRNKFQQLKWTGWNLQLALWDRERIHHSWKIVNSFGGYLKSSLTEGRNWSIQQAGSWQGLDKAISKGLCCKKLLCWKESAQWVLLEAGWLSHCKKKGGSWAGCSYWTARVGLQCKQAYYLELSFLLLGK